MNKRIYLIREKTTNNIFFGLKDEGRNFKKAIFTDKEKAEEFITKYLDDGFSAVMAGKAVRRK